MRISEEQIREKLTEVIDPELYISIVDLGLIYSIIREHTHTDEETVTIRMTLTTIGCPLFTMIEQEIRNKLQELGYKDNQVKLELTFEPPWSMDMMSERGKAMLGI